jgi:hypothetical protein
MADLRRRSPEPPPGEPQIQFTPGLANETLRELAPLLAEEGIDVDNIDVPDMDTLQAALNRAVERHNMTRFTPVGHARDLVITALRLVIEAIAEGNTTLGAAILEQVQPESPDNTAATVAGCIGTALGCSTTGSSAATRKHQKISVNACTYPPGTGLANTPPPTSSSWPVKGRAFRSLDTLITRQGGQHVLYGSALALAASIQTWSADTGTPVTDLTRAAVR